MLFYNFNRIAENAPSSLDHAVDLQFGYVSERHAQRNKQNHQNQDRCVSEKPHGSRRLPMGFCTVGAFVQLRNNHASLQAEECEQTDNTT